MFKAKLIEHRAYYGLRRKAFLLFLVLGIPGAFLFNAFELPFWTSVISAGIYVSLFVLAFKNQKLQASLLGSSTIEVDNTAIRIKGRLKQEYELNAVEKITLKKAYGIPMDSVKEMAQEVKGHPKENFLIVHQNGEDHRFDFEVDSYYMIGQLDKIANQWIQDGHTVERTLS